MKYQDARLLLRYARLQLEIARAKNPGAKLDLDESTVQKSVGYKKLRAWFMRMSAHKRIDARKWLEAQCQGIEQIKQLAAQTGEDPSSILADIEIVHKDDAGNEIEPVRLPDAREATAHDPTPEELEHELSEAEKSKASLKAAMQRGKGQ